MDHKNRQPIENSIKRQLDANKSKNLLFVNADQIMDVEPSFLAALEELLDSAPDDRPESVSAGIVSFAAQALLKRVYSVNQYLKISDQKVEELEEIYRQTWRTMTSTGNIQTVLREYHYPELSRWLATLYPEEFRKSLKLSPVVGHVVYEEYSAQLQIELLRIDVTHIQQPVIDIGCGSQANLVRHLRSMGVEAYGFDLHLEKQEPYLEQMDWFAHPFKVASWGTIISNMAFTNHLNYAHLHDVSQLEQYLLRMRDIIESLAIGGRFYYAPGLPFVEDRLAAARYKVERERTAGDIFVSTVTKIA
jgi:hypothetical protein